MNRTDDVKYRIALNQFHMNYEYGGRMEEQNKRKAAA